MSSSIGPIRLVRGQRVPSIFYGTAWKEERTEALAAQALDAGFRAIDTANQRKHYFEAAVGQAVAASRLQRGELFLQTKFTSLDGQDHRLPYDARADVETQVEQSFASSLEHLGVSAIDSYVLHGPSLRDRLADEDWRVWRAMVALHGAGKTKLLGVSNVSVAQLAELVEGTETMPAFVQNRCYARSGWDAEVRALCDEHDIVYQGFSLLTANRRELALPAVARIAKRLGRTVAQVVFRFALQLGMIPLTGTTDRRHMEEDLALFDFALTDDDVATLESIAG
jgi:diketogulonate reductase-like aldo/keto reductase